MRRLTLFTLLLFALAGCQTAGTVHDLSGHAAVNPDQSAFATLSITPTESLAAPVYTQLAMYRTRAAARYRDRRISRDQAQSVQDTADWIRHRLDQAVEAKDLSEIEHCYADLMRARDAAETWVEESK